MPSCSTPPHSARPSLARPSPPPPATAPPAAAPPAAAPPAPAPPPANAESPHRIAMIRRLGDMYEKYMLDRHVVDWLHLRTPPSDVPSIDASNLLAVPPPRNLLYQNCSTLSGKTSSSISVTTAPIVSTPYKNTNTNADNTNINFQSHKKTKTKTSNNKIEETNQKINNHTNRIDTQRTRNIENNLVFLEADDIYIADHEENGFVLGHILGNIHSHSHFYSSLSKLTENTSFAKSTVRSRKFAADASIPKSLEIVECVWFNDHRAIVILSLTTFDPPHPPQHCSEVIYYAPVSVDAHFFGQRPEIVLRLSRHDLCIDCTSSICECARRSTEAHPNAPVASLVHPSDQVDVQQNQCHYPRSQPALPAALASEMVARWLSNVLNVLAGRRYATLFLHSAVNNIGPKISFHFQVRIRVGQSLASRIQLQRLSNMPRTPLLPQHPPPPALALPRSNDQIQPAHPLVTQRAPAPVTALGLAPKQSGECAAERVSGTSLAHILNYGHESEPTALQCASSPGFDASPDSTRAAVTSALPSPLPPLPQATVEPLSKRLRTEDPRSEPYMFSLYEQATISPVFSEDGARVYPLPAPPSQFRGGTGAALPRVHTPAYTSWPPLVLLSSTFGKTPSPPVITPNNVAPQFQPFSQTPNLDLGNQFDVEGSNYGDLLQAPREAFASNEPPVGDGLHSDTQHPQLPNTKQDPLMAAPSLTIVEPMAVAEPHEVQVRAPVIAMTMDETDSQTRDKKQQTRNDNQCETCGMIFTKRGNKLRHIQTVHHGLRKFICDVCGSSFGLKADLNRHKLRVHITRSFVCDKCGRKFAHQSKLDSHLRVMHVQNNRPWECTDCNLRLGRKSSLTRHNQTVHQKMRFPCAFCAKTYSQKFDTVRHERRFHSRELLAKSNAARNNS